MVEGHLVDPVFAISRVCGLLCPPPHFLPVRLQVGVIAPEICQCPATTRVALISEDFRSRDVVVLQVLILLPTGLRVWFCLDTE